MNSKNWGTRTEETTSCQVLRATSQGIEVVAEFYAYGHTKQWRTEQAEHLAAIFLDAVSSEQRPSAKLRKTLRAMLLAIHRGAVRWHESRSKGHKWAGLIALATDGLLDPWHYLTGGGKDEM